MANEKKTFQEELDQLCYDETSDEYRPKFYFAKSEKLYCPSGAEIEL